MYKVKTNTSSESDLSSSSYSRTMGSSSVPFCGGGTCCGGGVGGGVSALPPVATLPTEVTVGAVAAMDLSGKNDGSFLRTQNRERSENTSGVARRPGRSATAATPRPPSSPARSPGGTGWAGGAGPAGHPGAARPAARGGGSRWPWWRRRRRRRGRSDGVTGRTG
jgi:hypothetical protein